MIIKAALMPWGLLALGAAFVAAGITIASQPVSFGWFAYAPHSDGAFVQVPSTLVAMRVSGTLAFVSGIALIAGSVGFLLGLRARRSEQLQRRNHGHRTE